MNQSLLAAGLALALLAACSPPPQATAGATAGPQDQFMRGLAALCGQAFAGRIVANQPAPATPDEFEGKPLLMHVSGCEQPQRQIRIPFHVGEDRSRTWVVSRTEAGLRLKHDHRHADGSPDPVTLYGGDTAGQGTATRQEFPVDAASVAMFRQAGLQASVDNRWALELEPGRRFTYELSRPGGRLFRVEFDLSRPVPAPPPAWGGEAGAGAPG